MLLDRRLRRVEIVGTEKPWAGNLRLAGGFDWVESGEEGEAGKTWKEGKDEQEGKVGERRRSGEGLERVE